VHATYASAWPDPTQANWMVSEAGDPDTVSGDSIMSLCVPPTNLSPINFDKASGHYKIAI
jgi:hypothetical protein